MKPLRLAAAGATGRCPHGWDRPRGCARCSAQLDLRMPEGPDLAYCARCADLPPREPATLDSLFVKRDRPARRPAPRRATGEDAFGVLEPLLARVARERDNRNSVTWWAANRAAEHAAAGEVDAAEARDLLIRAAMSTGHTEAEARKATRVLEGVV